MEIWKFIYAELDANKKVTLLTIIENKGSSPGKAGFKMAVSEDGKLCGSIGGGTAEYKMVELAKRKMKGNFDNAFIQRSIHDADAEEDKSGMICSGEQTQAFVFLNAAHRSIIQQIIACQENGDKGILNLSEKGIKFILHGDKKERLSSEIKNNENWKYEELIGLKDTLYIFGGGHVSLELSKIMRMLDFRIIVCDNRDALSTLEENTYAHSKEIINYNESGGFVTESENSYVAIMTVAHKHDLTVLKRVLRKKVKYLGMMGSKSKVDTIYELLEADGFTKEDYSKVDMPIGLPIRSKTPVEIAVSIAARIIAVKNSSH